LFGCIFWDVVDHLLMQFRWEKDWPAFFNLLQVFPECLTTFLLLHVGFINPLPTTYVPVLAYLFLFFSTLVPGLAGRERADEESSSSAGASSAAGSSERHPHMDRIADYTFIPAPR
jgi:hypothetical protein